MIRAAKLTLGVYGAEDPAAASTAITRAVRPAGGYTFKRRGETTSYVTLQGYVGAGGGAEWLLSSADTDPEQPVAPAVWPAIVLGPELGVRIARRRQHPSSLGLQAQVLDLGTLAAWRIGSTDTETVPDVELGHVFAPGLNVAIGVPGAPFSFLAGAALSPSLRDVLPDSTLDTDEVTTARFGLSLVVDIPLLY